MTTAAFEAHLLFRDGEIEERGVWIYELTPVDQLWRPLAEWVEEHLDNCWDYALYAEAFGLEEEGNYEVIFKGEISSWVAATYYGDEWDEEITVTEFEKQKLPDDWFDGPLPIMIPLEGDDETI